jgi:putative endonuclease
MRRSGVRIPLPPVFARSVAESVDCRAVALNEGGPFSPCNIIAASYDSAGQSENMDRFTYLYILQSEAHPERFYTGRTLDLRVRLRRHNEGMVPHTAKWKPWRIKTYIALSNTDRALALERYLKSSLRQSVYQKTPVTSAR